MVKRKGLWTKFLEMNCYLSKKKMSFRLMSGDFGKFNLDEKLILTIYLNLNQIIK